MNNIVVQWLRPLAGWLTVGVFLLGSEVWKSELAQPWAIAVLFAWLFLVIVWMAFGVVHEAEELAGMLGEPVGTLVLTLSIVLIEVVLIAAVMFDTPGKETLARDTMFSVLMIVLNGVVGLGLLLGGLRHREQPFNLRGAVAYLILIIPLATIALVLPVFTTSTSDGSLSRFQAIAFSLLTIALYGMFLWLQTGRHRGYFIAPDALPTSDAEQVAQAAPVIDRKACLRHLLLLLVHILPIVILSKSMAVVLDHAIDAVDAPPALGGIVIAMLVFTPEGISALKAARGNQLTRSINLCLGSVASTVGLTVPVVLAMSLMTGKLVILGLSPASIVLMTATLILSTLTFSGSRTTMLEGAVHLSLFAVFLVLVFSP